MKKLTLLMNMLFFAALLSAQTPILPGAPKSNKAITQFKPPYRPCDKQADMNTIIAEIKRNQALLKSKLPVQVPLNSKNNRNIAGSGLERAETIEKGQVVQTNPQNPPAVSGKTPLNAKTAGMPINISPNGTVPLGFNCIKTFSVTLDLPIEIEEYHWFISFETSNGTYSPSFYMGLSYGNTIYFDVDYSVYANLAYAQNGRLSFVIQCAVLDARGNYYPYLSSGNSQKVTLEFSQQPCINIHNLTVNEKILKSGKNGDDPELTVNLDAPAPPGGQVVYLKTSCQDKVKPIASVFPSARFFVIPAGQRTGKISGFIGTRKILLNDAKSFHIVATVNQREAYIEIALTRN